MTATTTSAYEALSQVLTYPGAGYSELAQRLPAALHDNEASAKQMLESFAARVRDLSVTELQELFTRTFDLSPACSLEVGWHLYGEEYARGALMVSMREQLRRFSVPENGELPDHLTHILLLIDAMDPGERSKFVSTYVLPAVSKMVKALAGSGNPYEEVMTAIEGVLQRTPGAEQALEKEEASHG